MLSLLVLYGLVDEDELVVVFAVVAVANGEGDTPFVTVPWVPALAPTTPPIANGFLLPANPDACCCCCGTV